MPYKVFVDDSGQKQYKTPYSREAVDTPSPFKDYEEFWRNNYFVICGVRVKEENIAALNNEINDLKKAYFKTSDVEIKSTWLRNPEKQKKYYLDVYPITIDQLKEFGEKINSFIEKHPNEIELIGVIFDKRFYGEAKRATPEGNPLLKSTQCLFERLQKAGDQNTVVFDQFESSLQANTGQHGKILGVLQKNQGMEQIYIAKYAAIADIKFAVSAQENFLQIADLCAYNVYRQFIEFGREWVDEKGTTLSTHPYFDRIVCNFRFDPSTQQVRGYGLCCIPDSGKHNWNFRKKCVDKKTPQK